MATRLELETQLRAHWPRLRRFAFTLSRDPADADDLVQDSAMRMLASASQWESGTRFDSWMFRVTRNLWIDTARSRGRRQARQAPAELAETVGVDPRPAIEASLEVGRRFGIPAASWGHAGDGNRHTTFLLAADDERELALAPQLSEALFEIALRLGGTISGEHGVGFVKRNWLERQLGPRAFELHTAIKRAFDPQNLLNPGKKA